MRSYPVRIKCKLNKNAFSLSHLFRRTGESDIKFIISESKYRMSTHCEASSSPPDNVVKSVASFVKKSA